MTPPHISPHRSRLASAPLAALAMLSLGIAACGSDDSAESEPATSGAPAATAASTDDSTPTTNDDVTPTTDGTDDTGGEAGGSTEDVADPVSTPAPSPTEPADDPDPAITTDPADGTTDELVTGNEGSELEIDGEQPAAIQLTPELTAFAEENAQLLEDWSATLNEFGEQAIDHLENVSQAPASSELLDLSDRVATAIGEDTTDPGLVAAREFASTVSEALTFSMNGDQESALTVFFELQDQRDTLSATLDQFDL